MKHAFCIILLLPLSLIFVSCTSNSHRDTPRNTAQLMDLAGIYRTDLYSDYSVAITVENGRLFAQGKNQGKAELIQDSQIQFHFEDVLSLTFIKSDKQQFDRFILKQNDSKHLFIKQASLPANRLTADRFYNIYPSSFNHMGPHSKYDEIDYLTADEKAYKRYCIVSLGDADFDRTLGYDPRKFTVKPDLKTLEDSRDASITWLGHAAFLIKTKGGQSLLTDPVFDGFDGFIGSLSTWLFHEFDRIAPAVVNASDVDFVNAVLISHNHYDHFNISTLKEIGATTNYYVPLNFQGYFSKQFTKVQTFDWYSQSTLSDTSIHFVPAHHYSGRGMFDDDDTLWGGWVLESMGHKIYFSGDTGYSPIFKDIADHYGKMDVCLMAIAAYAFDGRDIHMSPEQALKAADELSCKIFIPWGYGTWATGNEHVLEPLRRLKDAMQDNQYSFKIVELKMGETFDIHNQ